jgi:hypothetical protein
MFALGMQGAHIGQPERGNQPVAIAQRLPEPVSRNRIGTPRSISAINASNAALSAPNDETTASRPQNSFWSNTLSSTSAVTAEYRRRSSSRREMAASTAWSAAVVNRSWSGRAS